MLSRFLGKIPDNKRKAIALLLLVLTCTIVYWPVLFNKFMLLWDDQWMLMNAYTEDKFSWGNILRVITEFYNGQYSPVNEFFYIILYALFGYNPFCFHLACLVLHIANVLLVYFLITKIMVLSHSWAKVSVRRIAFITALLMAIHPFLVEAVAWISASKVLLYVFFYLMALLSYLKYIEKKKIGYFILTIILFVLSFGAKEQAVIFPICLLLIDYILMRNLKDKQVWFEKLIFFLLALIFGIVTLLSQGPVNFTENTGYPIYQRIVFACYSLFEYLVKCLFPVKLSYIYPFPNQVGESMPIRFWIYPIVIAVITSTLWSFWKRKWVFFGISFFIIHLALALHFINISRFAIVADRYVYLSAVGIFFLLAVLFEHVLINKVKYYKVVVMAGVVYILSLGVYAHNRCFVWYDSDSLKKELRERITQRKDYKDLIRQLPGNNQ
jgi:hypothetical protein